MKSKPHATYTMTLEDQKDFDPHLFVAKLKAAGFKFISEECPIKFAGRHKSIRKLNGSVTWQQWLDS